MASFSERLQALARSVEAEHATAPASMREYFERTHVDRDSMIPLGKPCHDCAITCGFYTPYADELAKEDATFQLRIAERWFCHNHPNRACAGVRAYLGITPTEQQTDGGEER